MTLGLITLAGNRKNKTGPPDTADRAPVWGIMALLAAAAGLLDTSGNLLFTFSSLAGRLDIAAVLSSLYPAGTILLAIWLLRERATRTQTVGMVLALLAVVMITA